MTPLREKMIKTMELRNLAKNTQRGYLGAVKGVASFSIVNLPTTSPKTRSKTNLLYLNIY